MAEIKHGFSKRSGRHPLYNLWTDMRKRCTNTSADNYEYYGGRGIEVCTEWNEASTFFDWALSNGYEQGKEIDRINTNGNYEPSNCRFVSRSLNCINRRKFKNNTSGYTGVVWNTSKQLYESHVDYKKKRTHLGQFTNPEDACYARNIFILDNNLPHKLQEVAI